MMALLLLFLQALATCGSCEIHVIIISLSFVQTTYFLFFPFSCTMAKSIFISSSQTNDNNNNSYDFNLDEFSSGIKACYILKDPNKVKDATVSGEMLTPIPLSNNSPSIISSSNTTSQQQLTTSNPDPIPAAGSTSTGSSNSSGRAAFDRWTLIDPSTIHYGPFASDCSLPDSRNVDDSLETFYITTAINYTNGPAHMGVSEVVLYS